MAPNTAWAVADYRGGIYIDSVRSTRHLAIDAFRHEFLGPNGAWRKTAKIGPTQQLRAIKIKLTEANR